MGVIAAIKPNGWVDKLVSAVASLGVAIPGFWLAMILVAEISLKLNWLPATGAKSFCDLAMGGDPARAVAGGLRSLPTAWPRWRGNCGARCWKCCRRNMCAPCMPRGCR